MLHFLKMQFTFDDALRMPGAVLGTVKTKREDGLIAHSQSSRGDNAQTDGTQQPTVWLLENRARPCPAQADFKLP